MRTRTGLPRGTLSRYTVHGCLRLSFQSVEAHEHGKAGRGTGHPLLFNRAWAVQLKSSYRGAGRQLAGSWRAACDAEHPASLGSDRARCCLATLSICKGCGMTNIWTRSKPHVLSHIRKTGGSLLQEFIATLKTSRHPLLPGPDAQPWPGGEGIRPQNLKGATCC